MKPTKNKVLCLGCSRHKMVFETEAKANNFIKFNKDDIQKQSGYSPQRSYYCSFCDGFHLTSSTQFVGQSPKEKLLEEHLKYKEEIAHVKLTNKEQIVQVVIKKEDFRAYWNDLLERSPHEEVEKLFEENILALKQEVENLMQSRTYPDRLKALRQSLDALYNLRKEFGFSTTNQGSQCLKTNEIREKEESDWKEWIAKQYQ